MLVKNWMSQPAITIDAEDFVEDAVRLAKKHEIHMLPVMKNEQIVGIITDRDIRSASLCNDLPENRKEGGSLLSGIKIKKIMTPDPVTVTYDYTMEETVEKLLISKISGLPVVNQQRKVIGVITKSDIFNLILILTGYGKKGLQLGIEVVDRPGCLKEITDIMLEYGGRISSILSTHERADKGNRRLYIRVFDIDQPSLQHLKEVIKERATSLYIVDYNGKKRECFNEGVFK
jgi:acetoin utilization protein AcuB